MDYKELLKPIADAFTELGFRKIFDNYWVCTTQELIIVLTIREDITDMQLRIGMGLLVKQIGIGVPLKEMFF